MFLLRRRWSDVSGGGLPRNNPKEEEIKNNSRVGGERGVSETDIYSSPPPTKPSKFIPSEWAGQIRRKKKKKLIDDDFHSAAYSCVCGKRIGGIKI